MRFLSVFLLVLVLTSQANSYHDHATQRRNVEDAVRMVELYGVDSVMITKIEKIFFNNGKFDQFASNQNNLNNQISDTIQEYASSISNQAQSKRNVNSGYYDQWGNWFYAPDRNVNTGYYTQNRYWPTTQRPTQYQSKIPQSFAQQPDNTEYQQATTHYYQIPSSTNSPMNRANTEDSHDIGQPNTVSRHQQPSTNFDSQNGASNIDRNLAERNRAKKVAFDDFSANLNSWHRDDSVFNGQLVQFLFNHESFNGLQNFNAMATNQQYFEDNIEPYLIEFSKDHPKEAADAMDTKIRNILWSWKYPHATIQNVISHMDLSNDWPSIDQIYKLKKLGGMFKLTLQHNNSINTLWNKLHNWFNDLQNLNEIFVKFLTKKRESTRNIDEMSKSEREFLNILPRYAESFSLENIEAVRQGAFQRIDSILSTDYKLSAQSQIKQMVRNALDSNDQSIKVDAVYDIEKLRLIVKPKVEEILRETALKNLEQKLTALCPKPNSFPRKFASYAREKNFDLNTLEALGTNANVFFKPNNPSLQAYKSERNDEINAAIYEQVEGVLESFDSSKRVENMKFLKHLIDEKFTNVMLCNTDSFKIVVKEALEEKRFDDCIKLVEVNHKNHLKVENDPNLLEAMKEHFKGNKCFAREICSKTVNVDLSRELQPYIKMFSRFHKGDELTGNENIMDEIDLTIYEVMKTYLKAKKNQDDSKADCVVKFMRRSNSIDPSYTPDLLFDEAKLKEVVDPLLRSYDDSYKIPEDKFKSESSDLRVLPLSTYQ